MFALVHCTCDGVMGEGLDVRQVVVGTVFLKPLAHVLLSPQHHGFGQTGQSGTCVVNGEGFSWTQLENSRGTNTSRVNHRLPTRANVFFYGNLKGVVKPCRLEYLINVVK